MSARDFLAEVDAVTPYLTARCVTDARDFLAEVDAAAGLTAGEKARISALLVGEIKFEAAEARERRAYYQRREAREEARREAAERERVRRARQHPRRRCKGYRKHLPGLLAAQSDACALCGRRIERASAHVDHIVPVSRWPEGVHGLHARTNLRATCAPCNLRRGNTIDPARDDVGGFLPLVLTGAAR